MSPARTRIVAGNRQASTRLSPQGGSQLPQAGMMVSGPRWVVDPGLAGDAARVLLDALGPDLTDESMAQTPRRMTDALIEPTDASPLGPTTFLNDGQYDELVLIEDLPVRSLCEQHILPFVGVAHIGYLPGDRILSRSKSARMVQRHARRPQTQEHLTTQIAEHLHREQLAPAGIGVIIEAEHTCMNLRGARAAGARTVTCALFGCLRDDPRIRAEFFALTSRP